MKRSSTILSGLGLILLFFLLGAALVLLERPTGELHGKITDQQGKALVGAVVKVDAYPLRISANTDETGNYSIASIPVGKYYVNVHQQGYERAYLQPQEVLEGKVTQVPVTVLEPLKPRLYINLWDATKVPGEAVALSLSGVKIQHIQFTAYRVDLLAFLKKGGEIGRLGSDLMDPTHNKGLTQLQEWKYSVPEAKRAEFEIKLPIKADDHPWVDQPGLYVIHGLADSLDRSQVFTSNTLMNRTDLGFIVKQDDTGMLVYGASLTKGTPSAGAQLYFFDEGTEVESTVTDPSGLWRGTMAKPEAGDTGNLLALMIQGDHYAYTQTPGEPYWEEEGAGYAVDGGDSNVHTFTFLYTERPLYRPGQTVFFKGIARRRNTQGTYDTIAPTQSDIVVEDSRGNFIKDFTLQVMTDGSFTGSFSLDEEAELGFYKIAATLNGYEYSHNFEVDEYRKPEFKIETTPGKEKYYAGDEISFLIDAQYFFGAPVEAEVEWSLYKSHYYYTPPGEGLLPDYWDYYEGDEAYVGGYGEFLKDGTFKTDAQGHAKVNFETPKSEDDFRYTLRMAAKDLSGRTIEREGHIVVTAGDFYFRTERQEFLAFPDKPMALTVMTRNYQDKPVSLDYQIQIERQHYDRIAKKYEFKKVERVKGKTDDAGRGTSEIKVEKGGYYHLVLSGKDSGGRKVSFTDYLWVSGSGEDSEDFGIAREVKIIPEKRQYLPGDRIKLFLVGPERDGKILFTVEGSQIYQESIVTLDGFSKQIDLELKEAWLPNVYLSATAIGSKSIFSGEAQLAISPKKHYLKIEVESDREKYQPGEEVQYEITTLNAEGQAVPAQFSLGVVDEKIYALRADRTDIKKFFWGPRPNRVGTQYSFSGYYSGGIQKEDRNLLRKNFKDTAYWEPNLLTDANGKASVSVTLPDNLTTWRATVVASTMATAVGQQTHDVISSKPLIARIAAPRFFTEKDRVDLKALIHNYSGKPQTMTVSLGLEGLQFINAQDDQTRQLTLKADEVISFNFPALAKAPGMAKVQLLAKNTEISDGVELAIPIIPYGIADHHYRQGEISAATVNQPQRADIILPVGADTRPDRSDLTVTLDTSFVAQLMGSLDYLVQYPYGCVEQTLSRFLPALMVSHISEELGLKDPMLEKKLDRVLKRGMKRLLRMQNYSGGWGWWTGDESDPFMTAYAMFGLIRSEQMGVSVPSETLSKGRDAIKKMLKDGLGKTQNYLFGAEGTTYFLNYVAALAGIPSKVSVPRSPPLEKPLPQALLALTLIESGRAPEASVLFASLERSALCERGRCHFEQKTKYTDYSVMASAWALQALVRGQIPNGYLKDGLARWLLEQRQGGHWAHTLQTAVALYALSEYARELPGSGAGVLAELMLNSASLEKINVASPHFIRKLAGCAEGQPDCEGKKKLPLASGNNPLQIINLAANPLYFQSEFVSFSAPEEILPRSEGVEVIREYVLLKRIRKEGESSETYETKPFTGEVKQGELVGVRLTLKAAEDLYYLMVEDPLPSGMEVMADIRFDKDAVYYTEKSVRDEKVTFFRSHLKAGVHVFNYALLPELSGEFFILPTIAQEMYRPQTRGSGKSGRVKVQP